MDLWFVVAHAVLAFLVGVIGWRLRDRRKAFGLFTGAVVVAAVAAGAVERSQQLAWSALTFGWRDMVFMTNLSLEGVAAICTILWANAGAKGGKRRAAVLTAGAGLAAIASYVWYFVPPPPGLHGVVDGRGYCGQTSPESCSAAAAVMLLDRSGIRATEQEMASLCLSRAPGGTTPFGLFRGLWVKGEPKGIRPRMRFVGDVRGLAGLHRPAIISVGLMAGAPEPVRDKMEEFGWPPGLHHSVLVERADPAGQWIDVADPSYGRERWPAKDIEFIWDGRALVLASADGA